MIAEQQEQPAELSRGERWKQELAAAKEWLKPWHDSARDILKRLKDKRPKDSEVRRVNLFTAEYLTKRAILYGRTPQATVGRRWKDAGDDIARVAGEELSRLLNDDIASGVDGYGRALGYALEDRLAIGMGQARVRYEAKTEQVQEADDAADRGVSGGSNSPGANATLDAAGPLGGGGGKSSAEPNRATVSPSTPEVLSGVERVAYECVKVDYTYWGDFLYSPCRYWEVCRWVAFGNDMGRKALKRRFNKKENPSVLVDGATIPLDATTQKSDRKNGEPEPPWGRARIWEIWDKEEGEVLWVTETGLVIEVRKDPYRLKDFFPCPRPLYSLTTTDELIPRPDFVLAQDLYDDLDTLSTRMHLLRTALRVVGMYDSSNGDLAELLNNPSENRMVPVKNWAMLAEKGGIAGAVQFFPIQEVAATLLSLSQEFDVLAARLDQVTGFSDVLRGQGADPGATATQRRIEASFGSARLKDVHKDFARFATELQALKAEIISKHFSPEEIVRASNMQRTPDAQFAMDAAQFLKQDSEAFRVKVQPEALASEDFAGIKDERMEVVDAIGRYLTAIAPLVQFAPAAGPFLFEILKWLVASLRGASEIEGVLDKAIAMAEQVAQQPTQGQGAQPDMSKLLAEQVKTQGALAKVEAESKARKEEIVAETAAHAQQEENQMRFNVEEHARKQLISNSLKPPEQPRPAGNRGMPR